MSLRDMTIVSLFPHRLADMPKHGMPMQMAMPGALGGRLFAASSWLMWWVMMIAMMTPSAAPYDPALCPRDPPRLRARASCRKAWCRPAAFAGGYLAGMAGFSLSCRGPRNGRSSGRACCPR